jgi:Na+/H+-dicarboxylate symporter
MVRCFQFASGSLPLQIVLAVCTGIALGLLFPGAAMKPVSEIGKAVIHWVKLIAGPYLFLTIVAGVAAVHLRLGHGVRLVAIALVNTTIAIVIGVVLAKFFLSDMRLEMLATSATNSAVVGDLNAYSWLKTLTPPSIFHPFVENQILIIAVLALITGIALRKCYASEGESKMRAIAQKFENIRAVPETILNWLIAIIPLAVLGVVAGAVSEYGVVIFFSLFRYVGVVVLGFLLQVVIVYGSWIFLVARIEPRKFFRAAKAPLLYAFGVNSSLATLPLTLSALHSLGVSRASASLGAGVATNLNNDGIVLYEALAVFFIAHLSGIPMSEGQMLFAALACIVAAAGITGIPEAGFISLSVVVTTLGLPLESLPLLLAVDWMIARGRSVVNVLSDMTLSIALDATDPRGQTLGAKRSS